MNEEIYNEETENSFDYSSLDPKTNDLPEREEIDQEDQNDEELDQEDQEDEEIDQEDQNDEQLDQENQEDENEQYFETVVDDTFDYSNYFEDIRSIGLCILIVLIGGFISVSFALGLKK